MRKIRFHLIRCNVVMIKIHATKLTTSEEDEEGILRDIYKDPNSPNPIVYSPFCLVAFSSSPPISSSPKPPSFPPSCIASSDNSPPRPLKNYYHGRNPRSSSRYLRDHFSIL
mmetsp:Transcript_9442/g.20088  ORF Transcript_9442/g.20088 Transcript_9442/m.20088 type:complete len:112 (+) Transcript_9442:361-696(+)